MKPVRIVSSMRRQNPAPSYDHFSLQAPGARLLLTLSEAIAVTLVSIIVGIGYHELVFHFVGPVHAFLAVGLVAALLYSGIMHGVETTQQLRAPLSASAVRDVTLVWVGVILLLTFLAFSLKTAEELSRGTLLSYLFVGYAAILGVRAVAPALIGTYTKRSAHFSVAQALIVGAAELPALGELAEQLRAVGHLTPQVVELNSTCSDAEWQAALPETIERIFYLARTTGHGDICISAEGFDDSRLSDITEALQLIPRAVRVIPHRSVEHLFHLPRRYIGRLYSVELQKSPMNAGQRAAKRVLDLAISVPLLIGILPFLGLIAVSIKADSAGPVFFRQKRLGHRGEPFTIFKFRTMSVLEDGTHIAQARRADPRVTRLGRRLRSTSFDELPQLFNVLLGNMSLVGPRPHAIAHDTLYSKLVDNYEVRQHVKPGITGWAQVNGFRGETDSVDMMRHRVELDIWYAKNASVWLDIKILFLTIGEVLRQRNAY